MPEHNANSRPITSLCAGAKNAGVASVTPAEAAASQSDYWRQYRAQTKAETRAKKQLNIERSTDLLVQQGIKFKSLDGGTHLQIERGPVVINFWPATGSWIASTSERGRGVFPMLKYIKSLDEGSATDGD